MNTIALLLALLTAPGKTPEIVAQVTTEEGHKVMHIKNPRPRAVNVWFNCGDVVYTTEPVTIPGRQGVTVVLTAEDPIVEECAIRRWKEIVQ